MIVKIILLFLSSIFIIVIVGKLSPRRWAELLPSGIVVIYVVLVVVLNNILVVKTTSPCFLLPACKVTIFFSHHKKNRTFLCDFLSLAYNP
jgi:hypothetical protein